MTDHSTSRPQNHRLQGLRGIAVIAVVIFHLEPSWLPGGFLGVDVFFVLSGFLIGGMLCRSLQDHGRINVLDFYKRRFTRIVPAALVVALLAFPLSYFVYYPVTCVILAPLWWAQSRLRSIKWSPTILGIFRHWLKPNPYYITGA